MSHNYQKMTVTNGFARGTKAGATVSIGASVKLKVYIRVQAKTVSSIAESVERYQSEFSRDTYEEINKSKVGGRFGFFACLFGIMGGSEREYYNRKTSEDIQQTTDSQAASKSFDTADTQDVIIEGEVLATGISYIPTEAHVYVNLTQMSMDGSESLAVTDHPQGKATDINGDDSKVEGSGELNVINALDLGGLPASSGRRAARCAQRGRLQFKQYNKP